MKYLSLQRCLTALYLLLALATIPNAWAQTCNGFITKTTADGLGSNIVLGVYVVGDTVYAATVNGLSILTDRGNTFTNRTGDNGLGDNYVGGFYVVGLRWS